MFMVSEKLLLTINHDKVETFFLKFYNLEKFTNYGPNKALQFQGLVAIGFSN